MKWEPVSAETMVVGPKGTATGEDIRPVVSVTTDRMVIPFTGFVLRTIVCGDNGTVAVSTVFVPSLV